MSTEGTEGSTTERREATILVRGETVRAPQSPSPSTDSSPSPKAPAPDSPAKESPSPASDKSRRKDVSEAKVKMQNRLPALGDDADVGVQKEHLVTRDGQADLAFTGTLLASAAPSAAPEGRWQEYRIYETNGGKHVFSKVTRNVSTEQPDAYAADVFDPAPSSVPSKLLRGARDLTHGRPLSWTDAAVAFFGYDPLAKALYRKLSGRFEEHIS